MVTGKTQEWQQLQVKPFSFFFAEMQCLWTLNFAFVS